jgi:hypothetical protein
MKRKKEKRMGGKTFYFSLQKRAGTPCVLSKIIILASVVIGVA